MPKRHKEDRLLALGYCLRWCRKAAGVTQKEMAQMLGVSVSNVSRYESGQLLPDIFTINAYAYEAGIAIDDILLSIGIETFKVYGIMD